jgi:catechol 2,3-dioxygenase-like lactoylglutathione lyase family enzyme
MQRPIVAGASAAATTPDARRTRCARGMACRALVALSVALALAGCLRSEALRQTDVSPRPLVEAVGAIGLTVADLGRSVAFYADVLTFEPTHDTVVSGAAYGRLQGVPGARVRVVGMRLGDEEIELTEYLEADGRPVLADSRSNDGWFQHIAIVTADMDSAYGRLRRHGVAHISSAPQRLPDWNPAAGGIRAFYFRDPDGHALEIIEFPPGKGAAKWHRPSGRLFLGIDHTAIAAAETTRSLAFYRDVLGLAVVGESDNHGIEQERLSGVPGARVRITTLRAAAGPGVELLDYVEPGDGRPFPADSRPNDLWHWQTRVTTADAAGAASRLRAAGAAVVSPDVIALPASDLGFSRGLLVRDPDGHAVQVVEIGATGR